MNLLNLSYLRLFNWHIVTIYDGAHGAFRCFHAVAHVLEYSSWHLSCTEHYFKPHFKADLFKLWQKWGVLQKFRLLWLKTKTKRSRKEKKKVNLKSSGCRLSLQHINSCQCHYNGLCPAVLLYVWPYLSKERKKSIIQLVTQYKTQAVLMMNTKPWPLRLESRLLLHRNKREKKVQHFLSKAVFPLDAKH